MVAGQAGSAAGQAPTVAAIERFNRAFGRQDIDATMAAMTDDCIFENTSPAPDGTRCVGQAEVRREFSSFFSSSPDAVFEIEEQFEAADHYIVRWIYRWVNDDDGPGHVRGVDVFKVRDGKVSEKRSYVKG